MTAVFEFGAVSAIGMFPITNRDEMREHVLDGQFDDLTALADDDFTAIWNAAMNRLRAIPRYRELFGDAYPSWPGARTSRIDTMTFAHASNAMAAFFIAKFTSRDSPGTSSLPTSIQGDRGLHAPRASVSSRDVLLRERTVLATFANCHR